MAKQEGKVFIGGLSWETTDQKLRAYFENYGTVQEAFVSYDKHTGRPRGFGFVVFADPIIADKVISVQHTIDRREVEAKRALPKEESPVSKDQQAVASGQRTKKIFVGGLAATVDEDAFRAYFEDFGQVEDAVVMFDHENKRPRGFGFITFAEEEAVEAVFARGTIQSIHDKQIEIKRAVPRDSMPPSPRMLHRGPPMGGPHPQGPPMGYEQAPPEMWHRGRTPPPHYGGGGGGGRGGGYGGGGQGGYRGGGGGYGPGPMHGGGMHSGMHGGGYGGGRGGGGMRSPPHHHHGGLPPQPFTPPAVVTGIPASMAATPEGAAAIASGQVAAAQLHVSTPMPVMPTQSQLAAMSAAAAANPGLQPNQLVASFGSLPSNVQAAATQLGSPPGHGGYGGLGDSAVAQAAQQQAAAQAQAAAAAHNLAELQQQVNLSTSLAQAQLQQAQAAQQQQQAQAAIWS